MAAYPGDTLNLEVVASAPKGSDVTYRWIKNGKTISGATGKKYQPVIQRQDSVYGNIWENYECIVSCGDNITSVEYSVEVHCSNLNVSYFGGEYTVPYGQKQVLTCDAQTENPNGILTDRWYQYDEDDNKVMLDCTTQQLAVTPTKAKGYGYYYCDVSDGYEMGTQQIYVAPFELESTIQIDGSDVMHKAEAVVTEEQKVTLAAEIVGAGELDKNSLSYIWEKWDPKTQEYQFISAEKDYIIDSLQPADCGTYYLTVGDGYNFVNCSFYLTLIDENAIHVSITSDAMTDGYERTNFDSGEQGTYTAVTDADFDVTYQWYFNGKPSKGANQSPYKVEIEDCSQKGSYKVSV